MAKSDGGTLEERARTDFEAWAEAEGYNLQPCNDRTCSDRGKHYEVDGSDQLFDAFLAGARATAKIAETVESAKYSYRVCEEIAAAIREYAEEGQMKSPTQKPAKDEWSRRCMKCGRSSEEFASCWRCHAKAERTQQYRIFCPGCPACCAKLKAMQTNAADSVPRESSPKADMKCPICKCPAHHHGLAAWSDAGCENGHTCGKSYEELVEPGVCPHKMESLCGGEVVQCSLCKKVWPVRAERGAAPAMPLDMKGK